jgi:phosphopantetheine--protein transferase-like protein
MVGCFRGEVNASGLQLELASLDSEVDWSPWLTADEARRAEGMANLLLRARFVVSRGLRRKVLAGVLQCQHGDVLIVEEQGMKPRLQDPDGWDFNLSHAGDYVALVTGRGEVGVDLEKMRLVREMEAVVERYFHPDEGAAWRAVAPQEQEGAFFLLWSAREAAMKCAGTGLAGGLNRTRIDPEILRSERVRGVVGTQEMVLQRERAPEGYVLVTAQSVS